MSLIRETLVPGIILVFGVVYYLSVHDLPKHSTIFPFFLMVVMPTLMVLILLQEYRKASAHQDHPNDSESTISKKRTDFRAPAVVFVGSIGYLLIFSWAGFLVASSSYVFFIMVYFGINPLRSLMTSVLFTAALYLVFGKLFFVDL